MAKTIAQLTELSATAGASDYLMISQSNVSKKISVANLTAATLGNTGTKTVAEGTNLALGTTTGTKIGTATTQKLGFYNATPVVQPALTADLLDSLQSLGLVSSGAGDTPLNLTNGSLSCGAVTIGDAKDIAVGSTTGTKIGTASTQKLGFWNATPAVQPTAIASVTTTYTSNAPAAATGSLTIANGNSPTVSELLKYCIELKAKQDDLLSKLRTVGIIAT